MYEEKRGKVADFGRRPLSDLDTRGAAARRRLASLRESVLARPRCGDSRVARCLFVCELRPLTPAPPPVSLPTPAAKREGLPSAARETSALTLVRLRLVTHEPGILGSTTIAEFALSTRPPLPALPCPSTLSALLQHGGAADRRGTIPRGATTVVQCASRRCCDDWRGGERRLSLSSRRWSVSLCTLTGTARCDGIVSLVN